MMKVDLFASSELAKEIGINEAIVVNKLEFWIEHPKYGKWRDGVKYIHNTYEKWQEQLPWITVKTVKRIFDKLVDLGIVIREKLGKGWNQTRYYALNYSHPIWTKCPNASGQNVQMDKDKMSKCYNTDTYPKKTADTTPHVVTPNKPTSRTPYSKQLEGDSKDKWREKGLKDSTASNEYTYAAKWLVGLDEIYQDRVKKYVKDQMSDKKIRNPIGYEREVVRQVWLKHMDKENHCDFVVTMDVEPSNLAVPEVNYLTNEERWGASMSLDEEMELLLSRGDIDYG